MFGQRYIVSYYTDFIVMMNPDNGANKKSVSESGNFVQIEEMDTMQTEI